MREKMDILLQSVRNSYCSLVFSRDSWVGIALFIVTFFYPLSGLCGLLCCLLVNGMALACSMDRFKLVNGIYGFNAVILGLALGALFPPNLSLFYMLLVSSFLLLMFTACFEALFSKNRLPYLVFPFLLSLWVLLLLTQQKDGDFYIDCVLGDHFGMLGWGDYTLALISDHPVWLSLPDFLTEYFISLSSVLFRQDLFMGMVLAFLLLCYSRIAFLFTLVNHLFAYFLYHAVGCEIFHIPFACFGFNFILSALALSCYLVPSKSALVCALLLTPVQFVAVFATTRLMAYFYLPSFSSAFCVVTLLFLLLLKRRSSHTSPHFSYFLERTPEENLYYNRTNENRFRWYNYYPFSLPFYGEWKVSQGVDGTYTHQGVWRDAFDFVVEVDGKEYQGDGLSVKDYYCYGKPVLAPADGEVVWVENSVEDNPVGRRNETQNWGNYVVIKHWEGFYSLMAHLKRDSFLCAVGELVKRGDELALCGNSGLSPYPHLHFQFQSSPYAGTPTVAHPFVNYMKDDMLLSCGTPCEGDVLKNMSVTISEHPWALLDKCVGKSILSKSDRYGEERWVVGEAYGYTYLQDEACDAKAWFACHQGIFEFQRYEGSRNCSLYQFFLSNFKVVTTDVASWRLEEEVPLAVCQMGWRKYLLDFIAPLGIFGQARYEACRSAASVDVTSTITVEMFGKSLKQVQYRTTKRGLSSWEVACADGFTMLVEL